MQRNIDRNVLKRPVNSRLYPTRSAEYFSSTTSPYYTSSLSSTNKRQKPNYSSLEPQYATDPFAKPFTDSSLYTSGQQSSDTAVSPFYTHPTLPYGSSYGLNDGANAHQDQAHAEQYPTFSGTTPSPPPAFQNPYVRTTSALRQQQQQQQYSANVNAVSQFYVPCATTYTTSSLFQEPTSSKSNAFLEERLKQQHEQMRQQNLLQQQEDAQRSIQLQSYTPMPTYVSNTTDTLRYNTSTVQSTEEKETELPTLNLETQKSGNILFSFLGKSTLPKYLRIESSSTSMRSFDVITGHFDINQLIDRWARCIRDENKRKGSEKKAELAEYQCVDIRKSISDYICNPESYVDNNCILYYKPGLGKTVTSLLMTLATTPEVGEIVLVISIRANIDSWIVELTRLLGEEQVEERVFVYASSSGYNWPSNFTSTTPTKICITTWETIALILKRDHLYANMLNHEKQIFPPTRPAYYSKNEFTDMKNQSRINFVNNKTYTYLRNAWEYRKRVVRDHEDLNSASSDIEQHSLSSTPPCSLTPDENEELLKESRVLELDCQGVLKVANGKCFSLAKRNTGLFSTVFHVAVADEPQKISNEIQSYYALCLISFRRIFPLTGTMLRNSIRELCVIANIIRVQSIPHKQKWPSKQSRTTDEDFVLSITKEMNPYIRVPTTFEGKNIDQDAVIGVNINLQFIRMKPSKEELDIVRFVFSANNLKYRGFSPSVIKQLQKNVDLDSLVVGGQNMSLLSRLLIVGTFPLALKHKITVPNANGIGEHIVTREVFTDMKWATNVSSKYKCVKRLYKKCKKKGKDLIFFSLYTSCINAIADCLERDGIETLRHVGGLNPRNQRILEDRFKQPIGPGRKPLVLLANNKVASEGLNYMVGASELIIGTPPMTHAEVRQIIARVLRRGQKESTVNVYVLTFPGVDDYIMGFVFSKKFVTQTMKTAIVSHKKNSMSTVYECDDDDDDDDDVCELIEAQPEEETNSKKKPRAKTSKRKISLEKMKDAVSKKEKIPRNQFNSMFNMIRDACNYLEEQNKLIKEFKRFRGAVTRLRFLRLEYTFAKLSSSFIAIEKKKKDWASDLSKKMLYKGWTFVHMKKKEAVVSKSMFPSVIERKHLIDFTMYQSASLYKKAKKCSPYILSIDNVCRSIFDCYGPFYYNGALKQSFDTMHMSMYAFPFDVSEMFQYTLSSRGDTVMKCNPYNPDYAAMSVGFEQYDMVYCDVADGKERLLPRPQADIDTTKDTTYLLKTRLCVPSRLRMSIVRCTEETERFDSEQDLDEENIRIVKARSDAKRNVYGAPSSFDHIQKLQVGSIYPEKCIKTLNDFEVDVLRIVETVTMISSCINQHNVRREKAGLELESVSQNTQLDATDSAPHGVSPDVLGIAGNPAQKRQNREENVLPFSPERVVTETMYNDSSDFYTNKKQNAFISSRKLSRKGAMQDYLIYRYLCAICTDNPLCSIISEKDQEGFYFNIIALVANGFILVLKTTYPSISDVIARIYHHHFGPRTTEYSVIIYAMCIPEGMHPPATVHIPVATTVENVSSEEKNTFNFKDSPQVLFRKKDISYIFPSNLRGAFCSLLQRSYICYET